MKPTLAHHYVDRREFIAAAGLNVSGLATVEAAAPPLLPAAVWDLEKAYREKTATRERVCLNGLWRHSPRV